MDVGEVGCGRDRSLVFWDQGSRTLRWYPAEGVHHRVAARGHGSAFRRATRIPPQR